MSAFFRRSELGVFVSMHGNELDPGNEEPLTTAEIAIIRGALDLNHKVAQDAMQPLESVFMLPFAECLSMRVMEKILEAGHSRIPVYQNDPTQLAVCCKGPCVSIALPFCFLAHAWPSRAYAPNP
jgi:Mg2+/Co2+ transporter CorB